MARKSKYPRIGGSQHRPKNKAAKCCCGALGTYRVDVQTTYMRGDDAVLWACDEHRRDAQFLYNSWPLDVDGISCAISGKLSKYEQGLLDERRKGEAHGL